MKAKWLLIAAFFVGAALISFFRLWSGGLDGAYFAAIVAIAIIVITAVFYHRTMRSTEDRQIAGDNLYYLGLLFTLVSLILALLQLFVISPEGAIDERAYELIGNFGVALISTVFGILARIFFYDALGDQAPSTEVGGYIDRSTSAGRQEVAEFMPGDLSAQLEAKRLRDDLMALRQALREGNDAYMHFVRMCNEQSENVVAHVREMMRNHTDDLARVATNQLRETTSGMTAATNTFQLELASLTGRFAEIVGEFNQRMTAEANQGIEATSGVWREAAGAMQTEGAQRIEALYGDINGLLAASEQTWARMKSLNRAVNEAVDGMRANVESMQAMVANAADAGAGMKSLVESMVNARAGLDSVASAASGSAARVTDSIHRFAEIQNTLASDLEDVRVQAVTDYKEATRKVNLAISEQLDSDTGKLRDSLDQAVDRIDTHNQASAENLSQARDLSRQMTAETAHWKKLSEQTRKSLVSAVEQLVRVVGKN